MFPNNHLNDTIVYWGSPTNDGYGTYIYATAVEIDGRWMEKSELILNYEGKQIVSNTHVQVLNELDEDGYLYLGTLASIPAGDLTTPKKVDGAYRIQKVMRTPSIKGDSDYIEVYL